jgi:lipopolysaccharide transport system permease protein
MRGARSAPLHRMLHNLRNLLKYRGLIQSLVVRDLKARYRGSVLGFFWSFVNPLLLLLIYTFVFTVILPARFPDELARQLEPYALFMFCGILPWTWFSSSLLESSSVLISGGNLIKKVLFPAEVLPIVTVIANMVHFFLGLPILLAFLIYYRHPLNLTDLVWFPVVVFTQFVFTAGLALIVSALTVHFRDLKDILANLLTFWFFATPIIYWYNDERFKPYKGYFDLNPFSHFAISYQEILFFDGGFGHLKWLLVMGGVSVVLFLAAYWFFDRLRDSFAEAV